MCEALRSTANKSEARRSKGAKPEAEVVVFGLRIILLFAHIIMQ